MKYYVFEVSTGDSRIAGKAVGEFDTQEEAVAQWHRRLATAMKSALYTSDLCMVIDEYGAVIKRERYASPVENPATEEVSE